MFKAKPYRNQYRYARIERDQLLLLLQNAIKYIDTLWVRFDKVDVNSTNYFDNYRDELALNKTHWPKWCSILGTESIESHNSVERGENALRQLASMQASDTAAFVEILAGRPIVDQQIYLLEGLVPPFMSKPSLHNQGVIYQVNLIDGAECDVCQSIRPVEDMAMHKLHPECRIQADQQKMSDKGYVQIENMTELLAIRSADITHEMCSTFWRMWTPPWVVEAIKSYNKSGPEYAGMTLAEFLCAMKPESTQ